MKNNSLLLLLISLFAYLFSTSLLIASPKINPLPVILEDKKERYPLGHHLEYLEDRTGTLRIEDVSGLTSRSPEFDVQFQPNQKDVLNFGVTPSAYWVRFQLQAPLKNQKKWLLEIKGNNWKLVQFYWPTHTRSWIKEEGGRSLPFDHEVFMNKGTVFRLPQSLEQEQTVYLRFESENEMVLDMHLWSSRQYHNENEKNLYFQGAFHGLLITMVIYNLFLYLSIRDRSYLFYTSYLSALTAFFMIDDSVGTPVFWKIPDWLMFRMDAFAFGIFEIFFILFVKSFLRTKQNTPKSNHVLSFSIVVIIAATILFVLIGIESKLAQVSMIGSILLMSVTVMIVAILCLKKGYTPAQYFLLASSCFIGAIAISALQALEVLPYYDPELVFMRVGVLLEAVLYSFALADRLKYERRLKEASQQQAIEEQKRMTHTFQKFVPKQFLRRISDRGIEDIEFGRAESDMISILFSDIRSFTHLSETMSPQELMNFLNDYFSRMNQPIHDNHGFIDKFIGDAIMALFDMPEKTDQDEAIYAVQAAIGMQESLKEFNQLRMTHGNLPIAIGIGIHSGPVIIGTVGSKDRMDSTVLGDVVNLASRLEGLTKQYQVSTIISSTTWNFIKEDASFHWRELDFVMVKGRDQPERIYEIFNADEPDIREKKQQILKPYHEGLANYCSQNWETAILFFEECLKIYPQDPVSQKYLGRCMKFKNTPPGKNWNGALKLEEK